MSLQNNLTLAMQAVKHTGAILENGAANRKLDLFSSLGFNLVRVAYMRDDSSYDGTDFIWKAAGLAMKHGCGNCGEHAAVAFMFLRAQGVKPIDFMAFPKPYDHNFLIIGRTANSVVNDYRTWGEEAVVCDAWDQQAFIAKEIPVKMIGNGQKGFESWRRIG